MQDMQDRQCVLLDTGAELSFTDMGQGEPLVFMPGFTFSSRVFCHQIKAFAEQYRVIAIDPRSHGASPQTEDGNDYVQHGKDLDALFRHLQIDNINMIGWSFGALSAWSYCAQFGLARLKRFVNIDMPPVPLSAGENNGDWVELPVAELAGAYHALLSPEGFRGFIEGYVEHIMIERALTADEKADILADTFNMPLPIIRQLFAAGVCSDYLEIAKKIDAALPSLFVLATHWAETAKPYVQTHFPKAQIAVLGGHMMFWEHPAAFNALLADFLAA